MAGMMSQNIINLVDTLMIGRLGHLALAGVGVGSFLFFVLHAPFLGVSSAIQTMVSRYIGAGRQPVIGWVLQLGVVPVFLIATCITYLVYVFCYPLVTRLVMDLEVVNQAVPYVKYRVLSLPCLALTILVRGFWNGVSQPARYLRIIVLTHVLNIVFNAVFIYGLMGLPALGAAGAGLASTLSLFIGTLLYLFDTRHYWIKKASLRYASRRFLIKNSRWMLRLGMPTSCQQLFFSAGVAAFFALIARLGSQELAIGNVIVNIALITVLPAIGFAMAGMTLVSQSLGRHHFNAAYQWPFYVLGLTVLFTLVPITLNYVFAEPILGLFISDPLILKKAILPLRVDCIGIFLESLALVFIYALNATGRTVFVMVFSVLFQWVFLIPVAAYVISEYTVTSAVLWGLWAVFQALQLCVFGGAWLKSKKRMGVLL